MQLPARCMAFAPSGRHALSAGEGERQIALWATPPAPSSQQPPPGGGAKKAQPAQQAAGLLSLEEPAVSIATSASPGSAAADKGDSFQVGCPLQVSGCPANRLSSDRLSSEQTAGHH